MCGITGILSHPEVKAPESLLDSILRDQSPRGPDHCASEESASPRMRLSLGHNRLSILDLSERAHQPMWDVERRYCIVFNGEIYNYLELREELRPFGHEFRTTSDTEVILRAFRQWGLDSIQRFNGMFAFAIFDREEERLWIARDRFGVKPLYYRADSDALYFASTTPALARGLGLKPNLEYAARGIRYWIYEDNTSISPYAGLEALPAGHALEAWIDGTSLRSRLFKYYDLESRVLLARDRTLGRSVPTLIEEFAHTIDDAVRIRLRSDVSVGVSLSGGLDSSTTASIAARHHGKIVGFNFGHPDSIRSEGAAVQALAQHAGLEPRFIWPDRGQIIQAFFDCLQKQDAPFPSGSIPAQYLVFKSAREHGFKVLIGGQGGDEILMGYRKFSVFRLEELVTSHRLLQAAAFLAGLVPLFLAELRQAAANFTYATRYGRGPRMRLRLPSPAPVPIGYDPSTPLWKRALRDVTTCSLPTLLRYEDRNSMGNSVESRLPFLDYRLVEFSLALPEPLKVRDGYGKWILRQAARGLIPERIRRARYKFGFTVNINAWIDGGLGAALRSRLQDRADRVREWLPRGSTVDVLFSDRALKSGPTPLAELVTLLWLSDRA